MDAESRQAIVAELGAAFGGAQDVSPSPDQPLHVLLRAVRLLPPWQPSPARALAKFEGWPQSRPLFWIDRAVVNVQGQPPQSNSEQLVLGESWRQFSFNFPWPSDPPTATHAIQLWLNRFALAQ
jgi:hypothetical protein